MIEDGIITAEDPVWREGWDGWERACDAFPHLDFVEQTPPSVCPRPSTGHAPTQAVVAIQLKNVGVAILLTILFGPLGMLYSTVIGAVVMCIVSLLLFCVTFGLSIFITWPVAIIWGGVAAHSHNQKVLRGAY